MIEHVFKDCGIAVQDSPMGDGNKAIAIVDNQTGNSYYYPMTSEDAKIVGAMLIGDDRPHIELPGTADVVNINGSKN